MKKLKPVSRVIIAISALLMITAYYVPIWQILMWAPQYPEGLSMKIWIDDITGDVKIISALNHYIGMRHIDVSMFPEFQYMIYILGGLILLGLLTAVLNKRILLILYTSAIIVCGTAALVDFYLWGYDYGHNLDPNAPIIVPGMSYQPQLIGTKQLLNFTAFSGPDTGGWIFLVAGTLCIATIVYEWYLARKAKKGDAATAIAIAVSVTLGSCSVEPEPLQYGKDACHACRMILMDHKFGSEIVTQKGKIYKFDDVNCLVRFLDKGEVKEEDIAHLLIVDFATPEKLIDARSALYVRSEAIKSPMASGVAAFETRETMEQHNREWKGILLSWGELKTQYK